MTTYTIRAHELSGKHIMCQFDDVLTPMNHDMIFMFHVGKDKYIFEGKLQLVNELCSINTDVILYKLQRRAFYRLEIPDKYKAVFRIKEINNDPEKIYTEIGDISAGGMKVRTTIKFSLLHKDDHLKGDIELPGRDPISVTTQVRHIMKKNYNNQEHTFLGLEFIPPSPQLQHQMTAIVMELYRAINNKDM